ncbi:SdrD B-like domain-containing protein [Longimicrobium sp.]|uniref:SdrD B-like domain-containing protein n=1 Tax=Longimicrobium sp. TaxID=2029185 RepID=UPI002E3247BA|nr:SdrD B-like domain-containing protein [Longimicrobium sp.]HEX6036857.1 SdrD B-like domain-containing protein [Longimicrobium sp.]
MIRIRFGSVGLALAAALFAAACSESTGPDGAPTDLTVRVYVDADGSGTFNAGDAPVAGATVTAAGEDGTGATATTDAQGAATLTGLEPGTYALSLGGNAPAGAVLTTASEPLFTATAQGGAATAEFRYAYFPGSVGGVLYRDDNASGQFEAGADQPAAAVVVNLYAGGAATGTPLATVATDAGGTWSFSGLRPGQYTVEVVPPQGVTIVDGNARQVNVPAAGPATVNIRFTGSLRIPVAQARTRAANSSVTVEAIVTAGRGQLGARNFYVQDATGGIQVFLPSTSTVAVSPGDSVRVSGTIGLFNGAVQIQGTVAVEVLGTGTLPAVRSVNGPEVMERTYEGQLVRVDSLEVTSVPASGTSGNIGVRTPQGNTFQLRLESTANVPLSTFAVGSVYTVTGVLDVFVSGTTTTPQLKPRGTFDVARTSPPSVAGARLLPAGSVTTVTGVLTTNVGAFSVSGSGAAQVGNFYIQDATGGIQVFGGLVSAGFAPGDSVRVTGTVGLFNGEVQISTPLTVEALGTGTLPAPRVVTGRVLTSRAYEGQLARIDDVVITAVAAQSSATSSFNVTARAPDGTVFTIRAEGRTNVDAPAFTVGQTYDIVGILSVFGGVGQIKPRSTADVTAG